MKAIILISTVAFFATSATAQKASISGDTAYYLNKTYYVGDTVHLAYGSGNDKIFEFVKLGSGIGGFRPLASKFSKGSVLIDKIGTTAGKVYIRGKYLDADLTGLNKVMIDLEGAIDNKELKE